MHFPHPLHTNIKPSAMLLVCCNSRSFCQKCQKGPSFRAFCIVFHRHSSALIPSAPARRCVRFRQHGTSTAVAQSTAAHRRALPQHAGLLRQGTTFSIACCSRCRASCSLCSRTAEPLTLSVFVSHTERGDRIRIISARRASRRERMNYETTT